MISSISRGISCIGKRQNNEDCIYPGASAGSIVNNLFIVCDGVGGLEGGQVASTLACEKIAQYFASHPNEEVNAEYVERAIEQVQQDFASFTAAQPDLFKMATTLALLYVNNSNAVVAHLGDSRVYHIRQGRILHKTRDHSLMNKMLDSGELTAGDAESFPRKNTIVRFLISANIKKFTPEVKVIRDLMDGDYFLLCSDGVLQSFTDAEIENLFSPEFEHTVDELVDAIGAKCLDLSADNYSVYVVSLQGTWNDTLESPHERQQTISAFANANGTEQSIGKGYSEYLNDGAEPLHGYRLNWFASLKKHFKNIFRK